MTHHINAKFHEEFVFQVKKIPIVLLEAFGGHRKGHTHAAQQEGDSVYEETHGTCSDPRIL